MALNKGRFYPPGGYLATGYISVVKLEWSGRRKGKWHPVGRGQGCYLPPYNAQDRPPRQQGILMPKMSIVFRLGDPTAQ